MDNNNPLLEKVKFVHQENLKRDLDRKVSSIHNADWNNKEDVELVQRMDFSSVLPILTEANGVDVDYVPRYTLKKKTNPLFAKYPPNKEFKYTRSMLTDAINYGMILSIQYRGETGDSEDTFVQGHRRIVYGMILGKSAKGQYLLRGYHLRGWSVSQSGNIQKEWRMFRTDRILSISFTGSFFRLPPKGYNMDDKGMKGGIIVKADFDVIRQNQKTLVQGNVIQNKKEVVFDNKEIMAAIQIDKTDSVLDLERPFENPNIDEKDKDIIRITFLKSLASNRHIAVLGALGQRNKTVKLTERGKYLGTFKVLRAMMGTHLGKASVQKIGDANEYELHIFVKKLN